MSETILDPPPSPPRPGPLPAGTRTGAPARHRDSRGDTWVFFATVFACIALVGATVAVGFGARAIDEAKSREAPAAASQPAPSSISVELTEFAITPAEATVGPGGRIEVTNTGSVPHNLAVQGTQLATPMLDPKASATLDLGDLAPGTYVLFCAVPGHEQAGMKASLHVAASVAATTSAVTAAAASPAPSASAADATIDFNAVPGPEWHAFDPTLQPADGATVHNVTFHATEKVMEVAPGVRQQMWTFNDQVPGPILRGHVGDVFNVTLVNDGAMAHSIDFHASKVDPGTAMRTLQPGQSLVYQFKADYAGIWMYHCGTAPALHHIGNGMYGAVVIDPPGLTPVDHEFVIVQSELYLGPQDQPGDLTKMQDEKPDAVVFNGYVNQYKFQPIRVEPGQRVRVWVLDAGPNASSSFHIVGTIFDTVFKEGRYELRPDATHGGAQTLDLQPAQGGFVELTLDQPGQYPIVTHEFANVGKGALGMIQAGDAAGGSH